MSCFQTTEPTGYLCLVLNAHVPYVRSFKLKSANCEHFLFESLLESYLPLLDLFVRLRQERVPFKVALAPSPILLEQLEEPELQRRFLAYIDNRIAIATRELERNALDPTLLSLSQMYLATFQGMRKLYTTKFNRNITAVLKDLAQSGHVELLATAATYACLPILAPRPTAVLPQIIVGVNSFKKHFGYLPEGFWLPACGYRSSLDELLVKAGVKYTILNSLSLIGARPRPKYATYRPCQSRSGLVFLANDIESELDVWSNKFGYFSSVEYRDYYRDLTVEHSELNYGDLMADCGKYPHTGLKYYRITAPTDHKERYNLQEANRIVWRHASSFIESKLQQARWLAPYTKQPPQIILSLNAEFLGNFWFEGILWLEYVLRKAASDSSQLRLEHPGVLAGHPVAQPLPQVAAPAQHANAMPPAYSIERNTPAPKLEITDPSLYAKLHALRQPLPMASSRRQRDEAISFNLQTMAHPNTRQDAAKGINSSDSNQNSHQNNNQNNSQNNSHNSNQSNSQNNKQEKNETGFQIVMPNSGSWAEGGFGARWLNISNDWITRHLFLAGQRMEKMAQIGHQQDPLRERLLNLALKELLLAQSLDWQMLLSTGQKVQQASKIVRSRLVTFHRLFDSFREAKVDPEVLAKYEQRCPVFSDLDYRQCYPKQERTAAKNVTNQPDQNNNAMPLNEENSRDNIVNYLVQLQTISKELLEMCREALQQKGDGSSHKLSSKATESIAIVENLAKMANDDQVLQQYINTTHSLEQVVLKIAAANDPRELAELQQKAESNVNEWGLTVDRLFRSVLSNAG